MQVYVLEIFPLNIDSFFHRYPQGFPPFCRIFVEKLKMSCELLV